MALTMKSALGTETANRASTVLDSNLMPNINALVTVGRDFLTTGFASMHLYHPQVQIPMVLEQHYGHPSTTVPTPIEEYRLCLSEGRDRRGCIDELAFQTRGPWLHAGILLLLIVVIGCLAYALVKEHQRSRKGRYPHLLPRYEPVHGSTNRRRVIKHGRSHVKRPS
jgi:hypothetical protein